MKKLVAFLMVVSMLSCAIFANGSSEAAASSGKGVNGDYLMATGSATGNYYNFGSSVCTVVNSKIDGLNITVQATGGSTENARLLGTGDAEFAMIQSDVFSYAHDGIELFASGAVKNFKAITACYPEMVQMVVRKDSGIKSVADMKGKNICVGAVGSGYEVAARQILGVYGLSYDDINETFADQSTAKNGVQDGTFDAMFLCSGYPNANVTELSLTGKIDVISIDDEHMAKLLEKYPFYSSFTPAEDAYTLGHVPTSVAVKCMLVCSSDFTDEAAYEIAKTIYENLPSILELNKKAAYMSLDSALSGIPSDLHPGARKYYEEKGLTIPSYLK